MNETAALPLTEAQRFLAENTDRLQRNIDIREEALRSEADAMTKDEIREALEAHNDNIEGRYGRVSTPSKSSPKSDCVAAFVKLHLHASDEYKARNEARHAAHEDSAVDDAMRDLIEQRTEVLDKFREIMSHDTEAKIANALVYHLGWHADDAQVMIIAARVADVYLTARARGVEPSVLAKQIAKDACGKFSNVVHLSSNLRMDAHGLADIAEAQASRLLLDKVRRLLAPAALDILGWL